MRRLLWAVPVLALAAGLAGCGSQNGNGSGPTGTGRPAGAGQEVDVAEVAAPALEAALKEQKGRVVLVDFWATWCEPCVKGFPHFVELHKRHADRGLTCISVSMDRQGPKDEHDKDKVLAFLKKQGATFPNFLVADPDADKEKLAGVFGRTVYVPYTALFDRNGQRVWDSRQYPAGVDEKQRAEALDKQVEAELAR